MEINEVYISHQNNHSNGGIKDVEQTALSDDFVESYKNHGVQPISNNNNFEKGNALRHQLEDRVLFRFVPKHVISDCEPVLEQAIRFLNIEYGREIPRHARLSSGVGFSIPLKRELFDSQASLSDSLTSSLSECSPLFEESRVTALISGSTRSCIEVGGVTSEFQSNGEKTLGPEASQVSKSVVVASCLLGEENSLELQEDVPVACKKTTLSYKVQEEVPVLVEKSTLSDEVEEEVPLECKKIFLSYEVQEEVPVLVEKSTLSDEVEEEVPVLVQKLTVSDEVGEEVPVLVQKSTLSDEVEEEAPLECKRTTLSYEVQEEVPVLVQKSTLSDEVEEEVPLECKRTTLSYEVQEEVPVLVQKSTLSDEVEEEVPVECRESTLSFVAKPEEKNDRSAAPVKSALPCTHSFCSEDKEFEFLNIGPVKRSSSLKSSASSGSLTKKKEVRFADVLGLDLESVQLITTTSEPPVIPRNAFRDLTLGERWDERRGSLKQVLQLCACFSPHGCAPDFAKKVFDRKVMLETLTIDDKNLTVSGSICVANVAYVKRIFVRYTTNGWLTYDDVDASRYLGATNGGRLDKFLFKIKLPASFGFGNRMEFAISFESGGHVYWDNNFKANYRIECYLKQLP